MNTANGPVHGEYKVPGGKLVVVDLSIVDGRMTAVQVSGDFFLEPASALDAIDAALEGLPADTGEAALAAAVTATLRSEEHTSELQSLMRLSYAVFCLKKKNKRTEAPKHCMATIQRTHSSSNQ